MNFWLSCIKASSRCVHISVVALSFQTRSLLSPLAEDSLPQRHPPYKSCSIFSFSLVSASVVSILAGKDANLSIQEGHPKFSSTKSTISRSSAHTIKIGSAIVCQVLFIYNNARFAHRLPALLQWSRVPLFIIFEQSQRHVSSRLWNSSDARGIAFKLKRSRHHTWRARYL